MAIKAIPYKSRNLAGLFEARFKTVLVWISDRYASDFARTTSTWSHTVVFYLQKLGLWAIVYGTDDQIYFYVSAGTKRHEITPKRAKRLVFQTGYRAKTSHGQLASVPGGSFGNVVRAKKVMHPGTFKRDFPKFIVGKWFTEFGRQVQEGLDAAIRQAYSS